MRFILILFSTLVLEVSAFGENVLNVDSLTGIMQGLGQMFSGKVPTVDVNTDRIMGKWHQMYKAAINFDVFRTNMFCPIAYFEPNRVMGADGFSIQEAYRVISKTGPLETYKRDVTKTGPGSFWMYTEEYFYPRQFIIMDVGPRDVDVNSTERDNSTEPYEWLIVTDANRLALMVFARDPIQFYHLYNNHVTDVLRENGFGGSVFWNVPQPIYQGADCAWPSRREVFTQRVLKNGNRSNKALSAGSLLANPIETVQNVLRNVGGNKGRK